MKKILWISRHFPSAEEHQLLEDIFCEEVKIFQQNLQLTNIQTLLEIINDFKPDDIVVTLPLEIIGGLCNHKIYPIQGVYKVTSIIDGQRIYQFIRFERIFNVTVKRQYLERGQYKKKKK